MECIKRLFRKKRTGSIHGFLGYTCVFCGKKVRLELHPLMTPETKEYYAHAFGLKLCFDCYKKKEAN